MSAVAVLISDLNPNDVETAQTKWTGVYPGITNGTTSGTNTETQAQIFSAAGTWSKLNIHVLTNNNTITGTFRVNGANGNQSVSISSSATGYFRDATDSDTVVNNDKVATKYVFPGTCSFNCQVLLFDSGLSTLVTYMGSGPLPAGAFGAVFQAFYGYPASANTAAPNYNLGEASVNLLARKAGTISNLGGYNSAGGITLISRNNAANGNQTVTPAANTLSQDSTNSDTIASGDKWNGHTSGSANWTSMFIRFSSSSSGGEICTGGIPNQVGTNVYYWALGGCAQTGTPWLTESNIQEKWPTSSKFTHMRVVVVSIGASTDVIQKFRINGANDNQSITTTTGGTGQFEDASDSDIIAVDDKVNYQSSLGVLQQGYNAGIFVVSYEPGISTETTAVAFAIAKMNFNITASDPSFSRSVNLAIAKMNFAAGVSRKETVGVVLSIAKMNFTAHVAGVETVAASLAIANPQISAFVIDLSALNKLRQFTIFG